ncbi:Type 1 protein phosphatase inhibitor [Trypanosoma melophagium]|uniref:Type 1 protein phosphatase inhibitor n=1 Tax=Trypanosoma melophagium TaxID=715481 RepID=UPI00351A472F|nr:Type 1 protein phosphatase inhibitor [Trypanosoma melophagium]
MAASSNRQLERQPPAVRQTEEELLPRRVVTLHLQPAAQNEQQSQLHQPQYQQSQHIRHVSWDSDVREHHNQQVSKSCCVFHKKKLFGESSSDESSSDSDSDSTNSDLNNNNNSGNSGEGHQLHDNCDGHHSPQHRRKKHPPCTKEHCYCGTRFH